MHCTCSGQHFEVLPVLFPSLCFFQPSQLLPCLQAQGAEPSLTLDDGFVCKSLPQCNRQADNFGGAHTIVTTV